MNMPTHPLVIDWPFGKPIPKPGTTFDVRELDTAVVIETLICQNGPIPTARVKLHIYQPIK